MGVITNYADYLDLPLGVLEDARLIQSAAEAMADAKKRPQG